MVIGLHQCYRGRSPERALLLLPWPRERKSLQMPAMPRGRPLPRMREPGDGAFASPLHKTTISHTRHPSLARPGWDDRRVFCKSNIHVFLNSVLKAILEKLQLAGVTCNCQLQLMSIH